MSEAHFAAHLEPAWADRADAEVLATVELDLPGVAYEHLAARRLDGDRYEICCIPFFTYGFSLGDVVEASPADDEGAPVLARVAERRGHTTLRIWVEEVDDAGAARADVLDAVTRSGCTAEVSSEHLIAVDLPPGADQALGSLLGPLHERHGFLIELGE